MTTPPTPNRLGRPRDEARHDAILTATQDLLAAIGYDRLTIESVASRCGVGKTTIYRRWSDKAALVADAVAAMSMHQGGAIPDTGSLRDDLLLFAAEWHSPDSHRDSVIAGVLTALRHHPELKEALGETNTRPGHHAFELMVQRAVARGEIVAHDRVDLVSSVLPAMVFHHITALNAPVDRNFIVGVIDHVVLPALQVPTNS